MSGHQFTQTQIVRVGGVLMQITTLTTVVEIPEQEHRLTGYDLTDYVPDDFKPDPEEK